MVMWYIWDSTLHNIQVLWFTNLHISISYIILKKRVLKNQLPGKMFALHSWVGLLDLAKSWLTRVLTISQRALSVRQWSARHCSISGRQWSGVLISPLLDGVEDLVQVDGGGELGGPEFGVEGGWQPELGDKLTSNTGGCIRYWKVDQEYTTAV